MAVTAITERLRLSPTNSDVQARRHTRTFLVVCNDINDGPVVAHDAIIDEGEQTEVKVPDYGDTHPQDANSIVENKEVYALDHLRFDVVVSYSTRAGYTGISLDGTSPQYESNPVNRYPKYTWSYSPTQRPVEKTYVGQTHTGTKPANAANDVFYDPPVMRTENLVRWTVSRWYLGNTDIYNMIEYYRDSVNSDHFVRAPVPGPDPPASPGIPAIDTAKIAISAQDSWESGGYYWWVTFVIDFMFGFPLGTEPETYSGHQAYIINAGWNFLRTANDPTTKLPFRINGTKPSRPQKLAEDGRALEQGADPNYLLFQRYRRRPFDKLKLTQLTTQPWIPQTIP